MSPQEYAGPKFNAVVAEALDHLWDYAHLGMSPLVGLPYIKTRLTKMNGYSSHIDIGKIVHGMLLDAIENLRPADLEPSRSKQRMYHTIFVQAYVKRIDKKTIASCLGISKRTLYRHRSRAIPIVAQILRDWSC